MSETHDNPPPETAPREVSREEARRLRARLLAEQEAGAGEQATEGERDPADASMVTLFLPGG